MWSDRTKTLRAVSAALDTFLRNTASLDPVEVREALEAYPDFLDAYEEAQDGEG